MLKYWWIFHENDPGTISKGPLRDLFLLLDFHKMFTQSFSRQAFSNERVCVLNSSKKYFRQKNWPH